RRPSWRRARGGWDITSCKFALRGSMLGGGELRLPFSFFGAATVPVKLVFLAWAEWYAGRMPGAFGRKLPISFAA
ncbi:MAG: hypothetical protein V4578_14385, partial [Pseudomonadota bacterium]